MKMKLLWLMIFVSGMQPGTEAAHMSKKLRSSAPWWPWSGKDEQQTLKKTEMPVGGKTKVAPGPQCDCPVQWEHYVDSLVDGGNAGLPAYKGCMNTLCSEAICSTKETCKTYLERFVSKDDSKKAGKKVGVKVHGTVTEAAPDCSEKLTQEAQKGGKCSVEFEDAAKDAADGNNNWGDYNKCLKEGCPAISCCEGQCKSSKGCPEK